MQRCPKCGYDEGADWPDRLIYLAFVILLIGFAFPDHISKSLHLLRDVAIVLWLVGIIWKSNRTKRLQRAHEELHQQRVKDHLSTNPANSH